MLVNVVPSSSLSPCGESGLKSVALSVPAKGAVSLPVRGEWIEILATQGFAKFLVASLPVRGEWIEIGHHDPAGLAESSLSPCGESGLKLFIA